MLLNSQDLQDEFRTSIVGLHRLPHISRIVPIPNIAINHSCPSTKNAPRRESRTPEHQGWYVVTIDLSNQIPQLPKKSTYCPQEERKIEVKTAKVPAARLTFVVFQGSKSGSALAATRHRQASPNSKYDIDPIHSIQQHDPLIYASHNSARLAIWHKGQQRLS